jgi:hypothetical protein
VPGGDYDLGDRIVRLRGFFIDRAEVTNDEYEKFLRGAMRDQPLGWARNHPPRGSESAAVTGVTYDDAAAFAKSHGKRLPTEDEWEVAARGVDLRRFPWGNDSTGVDRSPMGCLDLAAGVREWVEGRKLRGASWHDDPSTWLDVRPAEGRSPLSGFRCVMDE